MLGAHRLQHAESDSLGGLPAAFSGSAGGHRQAGHSVRGRARALQAGCPVGTHPNGTVSHRTGSVFVPSRSHEYPTPWAIRGALGDVLYSIRFPLMSTADFSREVAQSGVLTGEVTAVLIAVGSIECFRKPSKCLSGTRSGTSRRISFAILEAFNVSGFLGVLLAVKCELLAGTRLMDRGKRAADKRTRANGPHVQKDRGSLDCGQKVRHCRQTGAKAAASHRLINKTKA